MFDGVGEPFAPDEVGRPFDSPVEPLARRGHLDRDGGAAGQVPEGRGQAGVELGGGQATREFAQLVDRHLHLDHRLVEGPGRVFDGGGAELMLRVAQREPDRDEALLGAVVEVTFEPSTFLGAGVDDPRPGCLHFGQLPAQFDVQPGDLDGQAAGLDEAP